MATFQPNLGATHLGWATAFRVWAPGATLVEVILERIAGEPAEIHRMARTTGGFYFVRIVDVPPGALYAYRVDGRGPYPDPASRYQPDGVHGRSQVIDPSAFQWTDQDWKGLRLEDTVLYELHVGTFAPGGTFEAARKKLPLLKELGVTAVELMPVADFAGSRHWGYDGVAPFAPARCYGTPGDLRLLVDDAHRLGLAVHLEVVYHRFGHDGAYQNLFSRHYFSTFHRSPLGAALNFDGSFSEPVRDYFIENALRWVHEYHIDGLWLDAAHWMADDSPRHVVASIASAVHASADGLGRQVLVLAKDLREPGRAVLPENLGGWGLDAVWSNGFQDQIQRVLKGQRGPLFPGFRSHHDEPAEAASTEIPPRQAVFALQDHDEVGFRSVGKRLHQLIDLATYRAAVALLLLLPKTPLLFMGQEWGASSPFHYFSDHNPEDGRLAAEAGSDPFAHFPTTLDPAARESIPDPQDIRTFAASRLDWSELEREPHASIWRLHQALLRLRRTIAPGTLCELHTIGDNTLLLKRGLLAVICLRGAGSADLRSYAGGALNTPILSTEDECFALEPAPIRRQGEEVRFARPGAILFEMESRS